MYDIAMPLTLFFVTLASVLLNQKTEGRLKSALNSKELRVRDTFILVFMMAVMISLIVIIRQMALILTILFLFVYSILLFVFGYIFSKNRWFIGIIPPSCFIILYIFLKDSYIWANYLINIYALIFAILVTIYSATLFSWKTTFVFGVLTTFMDIVLVLVTGTMIQAAETASGLNLPIMVGIPFIPIIITEKGLAMMHLGLGDFFFEGLLAIQTYKKYGKTSGVISIIAMILSFFIFELFLLNYGLRAFPGTLMILPGWLLIILLLNRRMILVFLKKYL